MFNAESYITEYQQFEHGPARLRAMKKAIQAADEAKNTEWRFLFRDRYLNESIFESDDVDALIIFPEMLSLYDSSEELQADPENRSRLMWSFKIILENITKFTHIPLDEIRRLYSEFKARCERYGYSLRTYHYLLEDLAEDTGNLLPESEIGLYRSMPEDDLKDCTACEASHAVRNALLYGNKELAEKLGAPIFSGEVQCAEVPENTFNAWIRFDLTTGDYGHARMLARRLYPMIRNRMDLLDEIGTLLRLYAVIDRRIGLNILRRELHNYIDCRNHQMKLEFASGAYRLLRNMRSETLGVVFPADFPLFDPSHHYETAKLRDYFYQEASALAEAFDRRNGNTCMSDRLNCADVPFDEDTPDLIHGDSEGEPSVMGAVCKTLPETLTLESVTHLLEQGENGRFRVMLSQTDPEHGILAFQVADSGHDGDICQMMLRVESVPPAEEFRPASPVPGKLKDDIAAAEGVVLCVMLFDDREPDEALHVQLKLMHLLCPDAVAYLDYSRMKVLPAGWVTLAAQSAVPPLVDYLYTLHISGSREHDAVWITTQGLGCCGLRDLEIWDANKENYARFCDLLCFTAERILLRGTLSDAGEPFQAVMRNDGTPVLCTWAPVSEAAADYSGDAAGLAVRREMVGPEAEDARAGNAVLYLHAPDAADGASRRVRMNTLTEADFEQFRYGTYIASDRKTAALAKERYPLFLEMTAKQPEAVFACVELPVPDEEDETGQVWIAVTDADAAHLNGTLAEDCFAGKEGDPVQVTPDAITDFSVRAAGLNIRPNTAYLLEAL